MFDTLKDKLPNELHFNILKFLRHPIAELIKNDFKSHQYTIGCYLCHNYYYEPKFIKANDRMIEYNENEPNTAEHYVLDYYVCYECHNSIFISDTDESDTDSDTDSD